MSADIDPSQISEQMAAEAIKNANAFIKSMGGGAAPARHNVILDAKIVEKCSPMSRGQRRKYFKNMHNLLFPALSWEDFNSQLRK